MDAPRSFWRIRISNPVMVVGVIAMVATFMLGGVGGFVARTLVLPGARPSAVGAPTTQTNPAAIELPRELATHRAGLHLFIH